MKSFKNNDTLIRCPVQVWSRKSKNKFFTEILHLDQFEDAKSENRGLQILKQEKSSYGADFGAIHDRVEILHLDKFDDTKSENRGLQILKSRKELLRSRFRSHSRLN